MKISKKFLAIVLSLLLTLPLFCFTGCGEEDVFKIANCEDYIDEDLIEDFKVYYKELTGKDVKVEYTTYGTNEDLYNFMNMGDKYDLICPSDYMIEKMAREGKLQPLNMEADSEYNKNVSPFIDETLKSVKWGNNGEYSLATYSAGYMWGTLGLVYNDSVNVDEMKSWSSLWTTSKKFTIKDSMRDTYFIGLAKCFNEELNVAKREYEGGTISLTQYKALLNGFFNNTESSVINSVKGDLINLKKRSWGLEVDSGKNDILTKKIDINFAWSGDAVYAIQEAEANGVELFYSVPEEGSNIWFDGWCVPKTSKKLDVAKEFINFISLPSSAKKNMDYIGYVSCVAGQEIFEYVVENYAVDNGEYEVDLSYFFGSGEYKVKTDSLSGQFSAQYPSKEVIDRCVIMNYYNDEANERISEMWAELSVS